eukprot:GILK01004309.1.p1 GENE.GILK01004309.1~~GILK01004309.1.p1  ORF type:complete len:753 (+),score=109.81 GILK01004309.1:112-2259(+)
MASKLFEDISYNAPAGFGYEAALYNMQTSSRSIKIIKHEGDTDVKCYHQSKILNRIPGDERSRHFLPSIVSCNGPDIAVVRDPRISVRDFMMLPTTTFADIQVIVRQLLEMIEYLTTLVDMNGDIVSEPGYSMRHIYPNNVFVNGQHGKDLWVEMVIEPTIIACSPLATIETDHRYPAPNPVHLDPTRFHMLPCYSFDVFQVGTLFLAMVLGGTTDPIHTHPAHLVGYDMNRIIAKHIAAETDPTRRAQLEQFKAELESSGGSELLSKLLDPSESSRISVTQALSFKFMLAAQTELWASRVIDQCMRLDSLSTMLSAYLSTVSSLENICHISLDWDCEPIQEELRYIRPETQGLMFEVVCGNGLAIDQATIYRDHPALLIHNCPRCRIHSPRLACDSTSIPEDILLRPLFKRCQRATTTPRTFTALQTYSLTPSSERRSLLSHGLGGAYIIHAERFFSTVKIRIPSRRKGERSTFISCFEMRKPISKSAEIAYGDGFYLMARSPAISDLFCIQVGVDGIIRITLVPEHCSLFSFQPFRSSTEASLNDNLESIFRSSGPPSPILSSKSPTTRHRATSPTVADLGRSPLVLELEPAPATSSGRETPVLQVAAARTAVRHDVGRPRAGAYVPSARAQGVKSNIIQSQLKRPVELGHPVHLYVHLGVRLAYRVQARFIGDSLVGFGVDLEGDEESERESEYNGLFHIEQPDDVTNMCTN